MEKLKQDQGWVERKGRIETQIWVGLRGREELKQDLGWVERKEGIDTRYLGWVEIQGKNDQQNE